MKLKLDLRKYIIITKSINMYKQYFGKRKKMKFHSHEEYYETLGFLSKSDGNTEIYREDNQHQGAWSYEVRANCLQNLNKFTRPLRDKFTKGRGRRILKRINCNEFFEDLINTHNFTFGRVQNYNSIRNTIPEQYLVDFDRGYNL